MLQRCAVAVGVCPDRSGGADQDRRQDEGAAAGTDYGAEGANPVAPGDHRFIA
jgi:hypothetical protein